MALASSHPHFQESPRPQVTPSQTEVSLQGSEPTAQLKGRGTGREDKAFLYSYSLLPGLSP